MKFPDQGEVFSAKNKKYQDLIFLVPPYRSSKKKLQAHIEFINNLGFDVFTFKVHDNLSLWNLPITANLEIGYQHRIAGQIENLLNFFDRDKIVFSFGELSGAAIEAIARRQANDVRGLICEGGPSDDLMKAALNSFRHDRHRSLLSRVIHGPAFTLLWNPTFKNTLSENLKNLPEGFKILSVRGWKDRQISPSDIDLVFESHSHLDWRKLSLPSAGHLDGLKKSPTEYSLGLEKFLHEIGDRIS